MRACPGLGSKTNKLLISGDRWLNEEFRGVSALESLKSPLKLSLPLKLPLLMGPSGGSRLCHVDSLRLPYRLLG